MRATLAESSDAVLVVDVGASTREARGTTIVTRVSIDVVSLVAGAPLAAYS